MLPGEAPDSLRAESFPCDYHVQVFLRLLQGVQLRAMISTVAVAQKGDGFGQRAVRLEKVREGFFAGFSDVAEKSGDLRQFDHVLSLFVLIRFGEAPFSQPSHGLGERIRLMRRSLIVLVGIDAAFRARQDYLRLDLLHPAKTDQHPK